MSLSSSRLPRSQGGNDTAFLAALYLFEVTAAVAALALNRFYNILGTLTARQVAVLAAPTLVCAASAVFIALQLRRAVLPPRLLGFALAMNVGTVLLVVAVSELAVRSFAIQTRSGATFAGTLLLPRDWEEVRTRQFRNLALMRDSLSYFVVDESLGWAPGASRRSTDGMYFTSTEGFRSATAGVSYAARPSEQSVVIVGDSFTFGLEVPFAETWGAVLDEALGNNVAVLNLGVDGYGVDQAVLRYERDGRPLKPSVAILGFIWHDLLRTLTVYPFVSFPEWDFPFTKPRFVLEKGALTRLTERLERPAQILNRPSIHDLPFIVHDPGYRAADWEHRFYDYSYVVRFLKSRFPPWPAQNGASSTPELEPLNTALIRRFTQIVRDGGAAPIVVLFPARVDFTREDRPEHDGVLTALQREGLTYIDLRPCIGAVGEKAFVPGRPHYSADGNAAAARCLLPAVSAALRQDQESAGATADR
jgi:hypothetical protein